MEVSVTVVAIKSSLEERLGYEWIVQRYTVRRIRILSQGLRLYYYTCGYY